jgi:hypothetical protein
MLKPSDITSRIAQIGGDLITFTWRERKSLLDKLSSLLVEKQVEIWNQYVAEEWKLLEENATVLSVVTLGTTGLSILAEGSAKHTLVIMLERHPYWFVGDDFFYLDMSATLGRDSERRQRFFYSLIG